MKLRRIFDSQETASIKEARKLLVEKAGMTEEQADKWVRGDLRATFPILRDKKAAKFILGTTRLFVEQQLNDADAQNKLTRVLKEINEAHYDEFDRNLNGKSLSELYSPFEQSFKEADKATREASLSKQFGKSDYVIQGPYDSFKDAKKAWGNKSQDWCVFHREDMYRNYTSAGQRFYVAAQNGWESVSKKAGASTPKDAYGNSLIAISVDLEGNLATSTPRWNHANGGGDNTYTVDELEDILQMPFYDTFKPYTDDERRARGIISFAEAAERLASGEAPEDIFSAVDDFCEGFAIVWLNDKCNFVDTDNNLLSDQWFDNADNFRDGFARVWLNDKNNFIDTHNHLLSDQWFDYADAFCEGFACVELNDKRNFIDTKGNLLSDQWFDYVESFSKGFSRVLFDNRGWNFIDSKGNLLSDQWFDSAVDFQEGFARVQLNSKCNFIDTKGKLLSDQWFDGAGDFRKGFACVVLNGKYNFIDTKGDLLSDQWFDYAWLFNEGFARVQLNNKNNFIDTHNNLLSNRWFDDAGDFSEGFARVQLNTKWNYIDTKGNVLSGQWFNDVYGFREGFAPVKLNGKWNYIDTKGDLLSDQWFDYAWLFNEGFARVQLNNKNNFIDTQGKLLSDLWFDDVTKFKDGVACVNLNNRWRFINKYGKMSDSRVPNLNLKRLSKLIDATKRQKETITNWATKAGKNPDEILSWAEGNFDKDAEQVAAAKWLIGGYDQSIFKQALYICNQKKLDPLKQNPEELVSNNADLKPKDKPINPDDVLTDRQEDGEGNVTYAARDEDREILRQIINTHYGKDASPWCLLQGLDGVLTKDSANYWGHYNAYPKRIAFRNGRLLAFSAGNVESHREWWDRQDRSFPFIPYNGKTWVSKFGATFEIKHGDVFKTTDTGRYRLSTSYSTNIERADSDVALEGDNLTVDGYSYKIDHEDGKFYYVDDDVAKFKVSKDDLCIEGDFFKYQGDRLVKKCNYVHGELDGLCECYRSWGGASKTMYKHGKKNGLREEFYDRECKSLERRAYFKNDLKEGLDEYYNIDGVLVNKFMCKEGQQDGLQEEYYDNGTLHKRYTCKADKLEGVKEEYYGNGNLESRYTYKDDKKEGPYTTYFENGNLEAKGAFHNDDEVGDAVTYYSNGQLASKFHYTDDGLWDGPQITYHENGKVKSQFAYKNSEFEGDYLAYYEDGSPKIIAHYVDGNIDGEVKTFNQEGRMLRHELWEKGKCVKDYMK